jgi:hypothetical protein
MGRLIKKKTWVVSEETTGRWPTAIRRLPAAAIPSPNTERKRRVHRHYHQPVWKRLIGCLAEGWLQKIMAGKN